MRRTGGTSVRSERHTDQAISHGVLLAVCCLLSYKIIIVLLTVSRFVPRDDELLGGMWAVVATIFVFRRCYEESANAALMRVSATLFSFGLCLIYLLIFPFRPWGMVTLIAIGAIVLEAIGRSEDEDLVDAPTDQSVNQYICCCIRHSPPSAPKSIVQRYFKGACFSRGSTKDCKVHPRILHLG